MSRGVHDMGGEPAGPLDRSEHERTYFEQRVDAINRLLTHPSRACWTTDANRRAIESLSESEYFGLAYYEKWLKAMRKLLVERGVLEEGEIERRIDEIKARKEG